MFLKITFPGGQTSFAETPVFFHKGGADPIVRPETKGEPRLIWAIMNQEVLAVSDQHGVAYCKPFQTVQWVKHPDAPSDDERIGKQLKPK